MLLGYNTNGLANHDLLDAIELLAEIGYRSVAITIDHGALNPFDRNRPFEDQLAEVRDCLAQHKMQSVIETGARFLLDSRNKHEPTLLTVDQAARARRIDFLCRAIDAAAALDSACVSLWSGILREESSGLPASDGRAGRTLPEEAVFDRLADGLRQVLAYADKKNVDLGFEPEPGMFIDTMSRYARLVDQLDAPRRLRLTLDIGHLQCQHEPIEEVIQLWHTDLVNLHIEDMVVGRHEHLMFGEGEIDFPPVLAKLRRVKYTGPVHVELSRHSHEGPTAARKAFEFLRPLCEAGS